MKRYVNKPKLTGSVRILSPIDVEELKKSLSIYINNAIDNNITQQNLRLAENFNNTGDLSLAQQKVLEKDFNIWANDTSYLQEISKKLNIRNFGRVRMLMMNPKTTYSYHYDVDRWRVHIPLITNLDSFLVVNGKLWHLTTGYAYLINVTNYHLALNSGNEKRIHIVFDFCDNLISS